MESFRRGEHMRQNSSGIDFLLREKVFCRKVHFMIYGLKALGVTLFAILIFLPHEGFAFWPFEKPGKEDCITKYQKEAKCQAATYIVNEVCKCKFDSNCKYPNQKAIECILSNIGGPQNNSAAFLMRNACLRKYLITTQ
jgi:hypothetical protein